MELLFAITNYIVLRVERFSSIWLGVTIKTVYFVSVFEKCRKVEKEKLLV